MLGLLIVLFCFPLETKGDESSTGSKRKKEKVVQEYGKVVEFEQNQQLNYPEFSIVFLERVDGSEGTTASILIARFLVKSGDNEEKIEIVSGQLPAPDYKLTLKSGKFLIRTYKTGDGRFLEGNSFVIDKL